MSNKFEIRNVAFNNKEFVDTNFLFSSKMASLPSISKNLTYMMGKDSDMFPLTTTIIGSGGMNTTKTKLNDTQYTWDIMGNVKLTNKVIGLKNPALTYVGKGQTPIYVYFETAQFPKDFGAVTPDHKHVVRVQGEPIKESEGKYLYTMTIGGGNIDEYIESENFISGMSWAMSAPMVPLSLSTGNRSNRVMPGKLTNQMSLYRHSLNIAGNIANKVTTYSFATKGGGTSTYWMPEEMRQWNVVREILDEEKLFYSQYNRDQFGRILTIDTETGEAVPEGAGVKEFIVEAGNYSTYTTLTIDQIEYMVNRIYANRNDSGSPEIIIYTGAGGKRAFHNAAETKAITKQYMTPLGEKEISEFRGGLQLGKYFNSYKTIDGKIITVVESGMFNKGARAKQDQANGFMIDGFARESYNMVFLDHSIGDDGERNIQMVTEEGREMITGVYKGMANLPKEWGNVPESGIISTRKDVASYEMMYSRGLVIKNATTSFWFERDLD